MVDALLYSKAVTDEVATRAPSTAAAQARADRCLFMSLVAMKDQMKSAQSSRVIASDDGHTLA